MAALRAECVRTGVREVTVTKSAAGLGPPKLVARLSPVKLPTSKAIRHSSSRWGRLVALPRAGLADQESLRSSRTGTTTSHPASARRRAS